jgi:2-C-methyl-D-erythritol 4-phosphate cytidylyltransferase/2-C-methyl-D-erythritol 2,4-cyclodiphosphate synthase
MNYAILLAAGASTRAGRNKLWADIHGRPLWTLAFEALHEHPEVDKVVIVTPAGEEEKFAKQLDQKILEEAPEEILIVAGGKTRMESFQHGLAKITSSTTLTSSPDLNPDDIILDHNAANPNLTAEEISAVIAAAKKHGAAAVSLPAVDTILTADSETGQYKQVLDRDKIRLMQTPQAARWEILQNANLQTETDLTSAILKTNPVKVIDADHRNQKITFASDLNRLTCHSFIGEDSHRFSATGQLTLGGITVPSCPAMQANSDGDVILHAIGRALAQAGDNSFSHIADKMCSSGQTNSIIYLRPLLRDPKTNKPIRIHTISIQLEGARPRIDTIALAIKFSLAKILSKPGHAITPSQIRISAHTGEDLSTFGRGEGLRCTCILTVY